MGRTAGTGTQAKLMVTVTATLPYMYPKVKRLLYTGNVYSYGRNTLDSRGITSNTVSSSFNDVDKQRLAGYA
ncbi:hypothetical protein M0802_007284 [Mischocyttarus mexicanus]|nr:hypothetical protein M0802_007284 [Mischocyttarus mexicanus]